MALGQGQERQVGVRDVDGHGPGDVTWGWCSDGGEYGMVVI